MTGPGETQGIYKGRSARSKASARCATSSNRARRSCTPSSAASSRRRRRAGHGGGPIPRGSPGCAPACAPGPPPEGAPRRSRGYGRVRPLSPADHPGRSTPRDAPGRQASVSRARASGGARGARGTRAGEPPRASRVAGGRRPPGASHGSGVRRGGGAALPEWPAEPDDALPARRRELMSPDVVPPGVIAHTRHPGVAPYLGQLPWVNAGPRSVQTCPAKAVTSWPGSGWPNASRPAWNRFRPSTKETARLSGGSRCHGRPKRITPPEAIRRVGRGRPARRTSRLSAGPEGRAPDSAPVLRRSAPHPPPPVIRRTSVSPLGVHSGRPSRLPISRIVWAVSRATREIFPVLTNSSSSHGRW